MQVLANGHKNNLPDKGRPLQSIFILRLLISCIVQALEQTASGYALLNSPSLKSKWAFLSRNLVFETAFKIKITGFCICVSVLNNLQGQYHSQMGLGNYGGVHSLYLNPSYHAYSAYLWQVNLAGVWANANNNYLSMRLPYSAYRIPNRIPSIYRTESGNPMFSNSWIHERLNGNNKMASISADVYGPAASVKIKSWRVGLFTHGSAALRASRINEALAHAAFNGFDSSKGAFSLLNVQSNGSNHFDRFAITGTSRAEVGFNLAREIELDWKRHLLLGVSIKREFGFQGFHFNSGDVDVKTIDGDSLYFGPTKMQLVTYGDKVGKGLGLDLGLTYVFHKKDNRRNGVYAANHTRYFSKIGISIMDIGKVNYQNAIIREASVAAGGGGVNLASSKYSGISDYQQALDTFMNQFVNYSSKTANYSVGLPTRLVATADFQIKKNFYVGSVWSQSLRSKMSKHMRYQSYLMVSPRWEYRFFEFSLPLALEYDYRSLRMGASLRFGPFYLGTNSLLNFVHTQNVKDADVFIGIAFGNLEAFSFGKQARKKISHLLRGKSRKTSCFSF